MNRDTDDPLFVGELRARANLTLAAVLRAGWTGAVPLLHQSAD